MADWLTLAPADGGPEPVQRARQAVQTLVDALSTDRARIDEAKAELLAAEKADREALAAAMRRGEDPISNIELLTRARAEVTAAEHRHAARRLAIEEAQQELGEAIRAERDQWLRAQQREAQAAHTRATKAFAALEDALTELGRQRAISWWLAPDGGFDRAQQWPTAGLLNDARSSAFAMANQTPASRANLMTWCAELIGDPPGSPQEPRETADQPPTPAAA
jgi:hypothetical protein